MMLRCKALIFFFLLFAVSANAQREPDSVFYLKFASPLDFLLQPNFETPEYVNYARDSFSFAQHAPGKSLIVSEKTTDYSGKQPVVITNYHTYRFNGDGQISVEEEREADSSLQSVTNYIYLRTGQISMILKKRRRYSGDDAAAYVTDTTSFTYDRSGHLALWCEKRECIQRLYNSKQQLIVKGNALYGYIRGDYTYDYDEKGRLIQRRFLDTRSGVVLFTDTIQYSFVDEKNTILAQKHFVRVSGKEWVLFDEILLDIVHRRVVKYSLFYNTSRGGRGIHAPGMLFYTYDDYGKLLYKQYDDKNGLLEKRYAHYPSSDTLRTYQIYHGKKGFKRMLWAETIIVYNSNGLIASITTIDYNIKKGWRRSKSIVSIRKEEEYHWN